ncbi:hypothetical protein PV08_08217 [Exophiala spinifera]|uniref:Xylanolytic transcriptional activator regulatory domain-containing protein n=1 Tax=Exophiala spinifera TaxID=91928 RepID=A0A0D2B368_9EURO|nr:uncharacterized protein PV08_08217 [Exophiala spinifera]KIW13030.1 hypothetical protein PV08_08217 [Exophiala spinifera]
MASSHVENSLPASSVTQIPRSAAAGDKRHLPQITSSGESVPEDLGRPNLGGYVEATFYPFLETLFIRNTLVEDFDYLSHIGSLQVPQRRYLDELLKAYFLYIHPHLPLINEGDFWDTYLDNQSSRSNSSCMSLFVFQAMLLAACSFVPTTVLQFLGFCNTRLARATYYRRAKALYDFGTQRSNLIKAQGALLMTFHVPLNEPHINSHWLGIAINHAKAESADQFYRYAVHDAVRYNQMKRLWWCCIIRDRTLSLALRRPIFISSKAFYDVWPPLTEDDLRSEIERSHVCTASTKMSILKSLIALCELCAIVTDILSLLYPLDSTTANDDHLELMTRIYSFTDNLNEWHEQVVSIIEPRHHNGNEVGIVVLFSNMLNILFQSAKAALCNHRIMLTVSETLQHSFERLHAKNELQAALRSTAQSLRAIIEAGMITYSPISMVAFLALPSICYNLNLTNRAQPQRPSQTYGTNIYQDFLRVLQLRYEGTDRALSNMAKLMSDMNMEDATSPSTARSDSTSNISSNQRQGRTSSATLATTKSVSGIDIVVSDPQKYVQICQTLDFFLSRGRFPTRYDTSSSIPSPPTAPERLPSAGMPVWATAEGSGATGRGQFEQSMGRNLFSRDMALDSANVDTSAESSELLPTSETSTAAVELSVALLDNPFQEAIANPEYFLFEDFETFMTDGPYRGADRSQPNTLYD